MPRRALLPAAFLLVASCGGGSDSSAPPPPPPPPPPTVTSITVSAPAGPLVSLGATVTLTAEVRLSNGALGTQTPTWSSSAPAVATVAGGVVTAVGNGQATITATIGTVSGQTTVNVVQAVASVQLLPADSVFKSTGALRGTALDARGNAVAGATLQWESLKPSVATVTQSGNLTLQSTGVARIRVTSGTFRDTSIVRAVANVTQLSSLFPLFEFTATAGQRRAISDVSQAHADARAAVMDPVWAYLTTLLPANGSNATDMYFTSWPQIWTEFNTFCGGTLLVDQVNWTSCATPDRDHFFTLPAGSPDDYPVITRFLARQFMLASHGPSAAFPWFLTGFSQWLAGGSSSPNGATGKAQLVSINDFRTGDTQNRLAPLDTLMRLPAAEFFEDLPQRTPVAVRMAQGVMLASYLAGEPGNSLCKVFAAIRATPGNGVSNDALRQIITTATGKTVAELETGYLAHARALTAGGVPAATLVPVICPP